jgi:hypothetical protein
MKNLAICASLALFLLSCGPSKCDLKGCEEIGEGWENDNPECWKIGHSVCRIKESGGYCTKEHALKGLESK